MSESEQSGQEKTEEATPKRRLDARKKGQVPRSRELTTAVVVLAGSSGLLLFGPLIFSAITDIMHQSFSFSRELLNQPETVTVLMGQFAKNMTFSLLPFFILLFVAALVGPLLLGGWSFSATSILPKAERMSFLKGVKKMFSARAPMELIKALVKFLVIGSVALILIYTKLPDFFNLGQLDLETGLATAAKLVSLCFIVISSGLLIIAGVDIPFQLWQFSQQMKMTRQEVKDELKESDGRPEVKGHIRKVQQEMAQQRMMTEIARADVVITNPEHYAVALRYDSDHQAAPRLVAKGTDLIAQRIRELALENDVIVLEAPPLARAIYYATKLNHDVPAGLYVAVAQVLAYVYQLKRTHKKGVFDGSELAELSIPEELRRD